MQRACGAQLSGVVGIDNFGRMWNVCGRLVWRCLFKSEGCHDIGSDSTVSRVPRLTLGTKRLAVRFTLSCKWVVDILYMRLSILNGRGRDVEQVCWYGSLHVIDM